MDTTTSTLLAGTIVVVGRFAQDKPVSLRIVIGCLGAALALSLISDANPQFGQAFGLLLLVTACFTYLVPILQKTGLIQ